MLLPDVPTLSLDRSAANVVVPVIVLTEAGFNATTAVDFVSLESQLQSMLAPRALELLVTRHRLDEHQHLLQALQRARRQRTVHRADERGRVLPLREPYVDAALLRAALAQSGDLLTAGLLADSPAPFAAATRQRALHRSDGATATRDALEAFRDAQRGEQRRVLPIYVLELHTLLDSNAFFTDDDDLNPALTWYAPSVVGGCLLVVFVVCLLLFVVYFFDH